MTADEVEHIDASNSVYFLKLSLLLSALGLIGLLFSTLMSYEPFNFDTFLFLGDMELGFYSMILFLVSTIYFIFSVSLNDDKNILFLITYSPLMSLLLLGFFNIFILQYVEGYYTNWYGGGYTTINEWIRYPFIINICLATVLSWLFKEKEEEKED